MASQRIDENDAREESSEAEAGRGNGEYSGEKIGDFAEEDCELWELEELGTTAAMDHDAVWSGQINEICAEIANWARCRRAWESFGENGEDLLGRCPSCSVESRLYASGNGGGSGYVYIVHTEDGPTFMKEFRRQVLTLYRQNR